jgi:hypothetical protein
LGYRPVGLATAATIAAHTAMLAQNLLRYEPVAWAEELLGAATAADLRQLPRLYTAAGFGSFAGRAEAAVGYARRAVALESEPRYDSVERGHSALLEANAYAFAGRMDRFLEICTGLIAQPGLAHVVGLCGLTWALPLTGRAQEATAVAEETVTAARDHGSPYWIGMALYGYGQAVSETDPPRALVAWREGLGYTRERGLRNWEALIAKDAARLEAVYGELEEGLSLFQTTIDSFHRAGDHVNEAATLLKLASALNHLERPELAATIYGITTRLAAVPSSLPDRLRSVLGASAYERFAAVGAAMQPAEAVQYAREEIALGRREPAAESTPLGRAR